MKPATILFLLLITPYFVLGQTTIKGVVLDEVGPLSGVNIIIKNSNIGAISDVDGVYEIKAKTTDTLSISYLGYNTKDVLVGNQKVINPLLSGNIKLDEVFIVSYGLVTKTCFIKCCCYSTECSLSRKTKGLYDGVNDELLSLTLYPNPSKEGHFKLALPYSCKNIKIQVSNISGQIIKTNDYQNIVKRLDIDLFQFPSGIYIINIIADGKQLPTKKAIIGG